MAVIFIKIWCLLQYIIFESTKLVLSIEWELVAIIAALPPMYRKRPFVLLESSLRQSMNSIEIPIIIFSLQITVVSKTSFNKYLACLTCSTSYSLKWSALWQPNFQTPKCNSCFYICNYPSENQPSSHFRFCHFRDT